MKMYTIDDLKNFERNSNGYLICPTGDYMAIKKFPNRCYFPYGGEFENTTFGDGCRFGAKSTFGDYCGFGDNCKFENTTFGDGCRFGINCEFVDCIFGNNCIFGYGCEFENTTFGYNCKFGEFCMFGAKSTFGDYCGFGDNCKFGVFCMFGAKSTFGEFCMFGEHCRFGDNCNIKNQFLEGLEIPTTKVVKIDYIGSRNDSTYFFQTEQGIYVRCGCFFGVLKEFEAQVKETHKNNNQYIAEYLGAIKYIKSIMPIGDESNGN